jgi:hypothetical protein
MLPVDQLATNTSHLYSYRDVIQKSKPKEMTPKKYETTEFSLLCLPILNYCIVIVSVRHSKTGNKTLLSNTFKDLFSLSAILNSVLV